jgi:hypothetical protein
MHTSVNKYDALEILIFEEGLRIQSISFDKEKDLMLITLNTGAIFKQKISTYSPLKNANQQQLAQFELIANNSGVHWPLFDEYLSLKGFMQNELRTLVKKNPLAA